MSWSLAGSWRWLRNAGNRTVLGWLGGGLVVLAGGLWIVFTQITASPPKSPVSADRGGFAAGGNVSTGGGAITLGARPTAPADKPPANDKAGARP